MSSPNPVPVLVVGSGPAGLVLALTLAKNGISVRIIEKEAQRDVGQRGSGIQPRSVELYNYLGVLPDVAAKAIPFQSIRKYKLPGGIEPLSTIAMMPRVEPTPDRPYPNPFMLGQHNAEAILQSHLAKFGVRVEYQMRLQDFEQYDDRVVAHVVQEDAGEEKLHDITCHWLAGTDGARSVVRKQLGLQFLGETQDRLHAVTGDIYTKGLDTEYWHTWGDPTTNLVHLRPTEDEGVFIFLIAGQIDHQRLVSDNDELIKQIRKITQRNDLEFGQVRTAYEYRPNIRMVDRFGEGRVFVAGDAAHVHSANGGQGMNSSIQDSFNLGWKLALVEKGYAAPSLLTTYSEERHPVIAAMLQRTTTLLNNTVSGNADAHKREDVMKQLGVNCRWSSIVVDDRAAPADAAELKANAYGGGGDSLRAGDRAPDAPGLVDVRASDAPTSCFRIFSPTHHTVVFFTADLHLLVEQLGVLAAYPPQTIKTVLVLPQGHPGVSPEAVKGIDLVVTDCDGHAYGGYEVSKKGLTTAVIRPDGIVGGIVLGLAGLQRYFKGVFAEST